MDSIGMTSDSRRRALAAGVVAFNAGRFLVAHEIWEVVWNDAVGEERRFVQGLVQLAAGYLKLSSGQRAGARKLLTRACQTFESFPSAFAGLDIGNVVNASRQLTRLSKPDMPVSDFPPQPSEIGD